VLIDSLVRLNSSSRNAISAALILIVVIAMYSWIVEPHVKYLYAVQRYEPVLDSVARQSEAMREAIKIKQEKTEELKQEFAQLQGTLFTAEKAKEFFSDLQVISEETGCMVQSVNMITKGAVRDGERSEYTSGILPNSAVLSVVGLYGDVIKLLERLQSRAQKVWIESVLMKGISEESDRLRCDIAITMYTLQDKEAKIDE
jgi:hypothetical protein